jgi:AcrR family transcriptional regulator
MTPRPYVPIERQRAVDAGRDRILAAARELLQLDDVAAFSLDAVARRAGVTRMTVYNQFGSRVGLLEQLFDLLVERGAFYEMPAVIAQTDAASAFDALVGIFGRFYTDNRPVMVRLSAVAGTDADLDEAMRTRNERRRRVVETLVQRIPKGQRTGVAAGELVNTLDVMLSFGTFNAMAGPDRAPSDVVPVMRQLIRGLIGSPPAKRKRSARASKKPG